MFSFPLQWVLASCLLIAVFAGWFFYKNQNHTAALGGRISKPKLVWLCLAIYIYFALTTVLALEMNVAIGLRIIFGAIAALMWLRAVGELFLLYGIKKWSPKIGIGHNVFCLTAILAGVVFFKIPLDGYWDLYLVLGLISLCLSLDSFYAYQFRKIVHGKTKGPDGLWFADGQEERFRRLNRITETWNWVVALILVFFLARNLL